MVILEEQNKKEKTLAPEGAAQAAICTSVIELGTRVDNYYENERLVNIFDLGFELPDSTITINGDEVPQTVYKKIYLRSEKEQVGRSIKKNLGKWLTNYDELAKKGTTLQEALLGRPALLTITHEKGTKSTYAKVTDISAMPVKMAAGMKPHGEVWSYDPSDPNTNWDKLPTWHQDDIRLSAEFKQAKGEVTGETDEF